jgi:hypothetical protein
VTSACFSHHNTRFWPISLLQQNSSVTTTRQKRPDEPSIDTETATTLEWIGFTPAKAKEIEKHWRRPVDKGPYGFLSYCNAHIEILECTKNFIDMSVEDSMRELGFKQWLIDVFRDPQFAEVRKTQSSRCWLEETVEIGYHTYDAMVNPHRFKTKILDRLMTDETKLILPGHRSLYLAKTYTEVIERHNYKTSFSLTRFRTYGYGDFNHDSINVLVYFTPEKETAELLRRWVAARVPQAKTCIIRLQLPESVMNCSRVKKLMYSDEWEEMVNVCKYGTSPEDGFDQPFEDFDIVHGHISCQEEEFVDGHTVWEGGEQCFGDLRPMQLKDGTFATQTVFIGKDIWRSLVKGIEGRVHIEVVPALVEGVQEQKCSL